jgi:DNA-binding GntR family transcriptional regulator
LTDNVEMWNDVAMADSPLQRVSTVVALTNALRDRVLSGQEAPGAPLRESELCVEYGVSRHSLRAGMQALVHEGLLRHEPNRGTFVPQLTRRDIEDIYQVRIALETEAARTAIERKRDFQGLIEAFGELSDLTADAPWHRVRDADLSFHRALVDSADNGRMSRFFASLEGELRLCMEHFRIHFEHHALVVAEHGALLDSIVSGSAVQAVEQLREHLLEAAEEILSAADTSGKAL